MCLSLSSTLDPARPDQTQPDPETNLLHAISQLNQVGFGSNFQDNLRPIKDCDWSWKFLDPFSQNSILGKKRRAYTKSGKNSTNSDLAQTFRVTSDQ